MRGADIDAETRDGHLTDQSDAVRAQETWNHTFYETSRILAHPLRQGSCCARAMLVIR